MKDKIPYFLALICVNLSLVLTSTAAEPDAESGVVEARQTVPQNEALNYVLKVYPSEIKIGDPVYFELFWENTSDGSVEDSVYIFNRYEREQLHWELCLPDGSEKYRFLTELCTRPGVAELICKRNDFLPRERRNFGMGVVELPSLEDFELEFWKNFERALPPEGIDCSLVLTDRRHRTVYQSKVTIRIKPRPESERRLLQTWLERTPDENKPTIDAWDETQKEE